MLDGHSLVSSWLVVRLRLCSQHFLMAECHSGPDHCARRHGPVVSEQLSNDQYFLALNIYREGDLASAAEAFNDALGLCRKDPTVAGLMPFLSMRCWANAFIKSVICPQR